MCITLCLITIALKKSFTVIALQLQDLHASTDASFTSLTALLHCSSIAFSFSVHMLSYLVRMTGAVLRHVAHVKFWGVLRPQQRVKSKLQL